MKASSILLFNDVPENHLENKLNKIKVVLEKKIYVTCQQNAWVDLNVFVKWLNTIWFRSYQFRELKESILYFDKVPSYMKNEVNTLFQNNNREFRVIPPGIKIN